MTNVLALILVTLVTNITNVQVPNPEPGTRNPEPSLIRVETTEILETSTITFEWQGQPRVVAFHNRVVSRVVRKFRTKQIEEEIK